VKRLPASLELERPPRAQDSTGPGWLLLPATVLGLVTAGGLLVATTSASRTASAGSQPPATAPAATPAAAAAVTGAGPAAAPAADAAALASPPVDVMWRVFDGFALPEGSADGPRTVDGAVEAGFAHSPRGALLAAVQITARMLVAPGDGWRQVVLRQVLPGPGRDAWLRVRGEAAADGMPGTTADYAQVAGYRYVTWSPDVAVLQLVTRTALADAPDALAVSTLTLRWTEVGPEGADWRLELQPDGSPTPSRQAVRDLLRFVPWGWQ